ncbi:hypothetical protein BASA83_003600 [Batrachochytrium salamandrivorans]|nr:hypothetical protein BASA83_003600 [Batrachochytrium salamandrivorans]
MATDLYPPVVHMLLASGLSHCTTALSGSGGTCNSLVFMHTFSCNRSVHVSATHNFSSSSSSSSSGSLSDPSPIDHFDICIVGGSIIGTAAACAIAHSPYTSGKRIALVEAGIFLEYLHLHKASLLTE